MGARVWGKPYDTGELADTTNYQPVKMNDNIILRGLRTWLIFYNDPTVTSFNMKIYSDTTSSSTPAGVGDLLWTSTNTLTKAQIITLENGYKEIYFDFDDVNLQENTWYNFVINATGYSPGASLSSHVAWRQAFPDPVYSTNLDVEVATLNTFPFAIYFIGAEL